MLKDFQEFINRGNVVDLAVGVIIGAAFAPIIASLVDNVIMPPIGLLLGGIDFSAFGVILRDADQYASVPAAIEAGAPVIAYGIFINAVINFLITAAAVFVVIRFYERAKRRWEVKAADPAEDPKPPQNEILLAEIRDLLAAQTRGGSAADR